MSIERLLLIDGSGIAYRCYFALPRLSNSKGFPTQAIYGFANIMFKILDEISPNYIAVAFDTPAPSFRHETYREYKAHRQAMPDEMSIQIPYIKKLLKAMSITILECPGYEADDVIATLVHRFKNELEIFVISGDYDLLALVDEKVRVLVPRKGITEVETFDIKAVEEKLGVLPHKIPLFKALAGDTSDNIKGIEGIGKSSAIEILKDINTMEELVSKIPSLPSRLRSKLEGKKEEIRENLFLATLKKDLPINIEINDLAIKPPNIEEIKNIAIELEMKTILKKFSIDIPTNTNIEIHMEKRSIEDLINIIKDKIYLALSPEIDFSQYPPKLKGLFISTDENIYRVDGDRDNLKRFVSDLIKDKSIAIYDMKSLWKAIDIEKVEPLNILDVSILGYLLDPSQDVTLNKLVDKYIKERLPQECAIYKLGSILKDEIKKNDMDELYNRIELPLTKVLASMELKGVLIDVDYLQELSKVLEVSLSQTEREIYNLAGEVFNINSPKQLAYILFEKLKLPPVKKTKTGYSTDAEVLTQLATESEICLKLLEFRELTKLKSTYVDALPKLINPYTGRLHTTFSQTSTSTGRLASSDPNLQNIPIRSEIGKEIRRAFIAPKGYKLISADYSQIELRVLAHLSGDPLLIEAFENGVDIHSQTAVKILGVKPEDVTPNLRRLAKTINFGIIYGMSDYGLSKELGIHKREAKEYIENYFKTYKVVKEFLESLKETAKEKGYVTTIFNRRRYIPQIKSGNKTERELGERLAINTPIQGSAADLIKLAMVNLYKVLREKGLPADILLQIHDELLIEVREDVTNELAQIVKETMENAYPMKVPITVDIKIGDNWCEI
ncbi:MAG: DNA polymerase I [bacterium]|nr:DNA polymerase I [bacterium]